MRKTQPLLALISLFITCNSFSSEVVDYGATLHESQWGWTGTRMQCILQHEIPHYGKALFSQSAGEGITFSLRRKMQLPKVKDVQLVSVAPAWKHDRKDEVLWDIPLADNSKRIDLNGEYSLRIFNELTQGMAPTFNYIDPIDGRLKVLTTISPVWLGPALAEFTTCIANLFPYNFQQIRHSKYYFDFGSSALRPDTRERIDLLAEFILANRNIRRIRIDGHTDNVGRRYYNQSLGYRRAEALLGYLIEKGVDEEKILIRTYGEKKPEASNKSPEGRAINRRIFVTLDQ
ncbi:OmpA family protein [Pseudomonadota bacterium]